MYKVHTYMIFYKKDHEDLISIVWAPLEHWKTAYSLIRLSITVTLLELQDLLILPWSIATKNLINPKKSQKRTWWSSLSFSDALEIFKRPSEGGPPCSILFFSKRSIHQEEVVGRCPRLIENQQSDSNPAAAA